MDLRGAVALVTGGNGGLGQRICHALAKEGAHIAVMYAQSRDQAEGVARELTSRYQINAAAFACDITDAAAVDKLIGDVTSASAASTFSINDAAYNKAIAFTDLDNLTQEVWDKIIAVNLTGPMRLTKAVAPVMKAQGRGRIVNIASVAGLGPTGSSIAYAVSKAGLIHLTHCMAVALAPETLVNCVAPGLLEGTRATANLRPEMVERNARRLAAEEARRQGRLRRHGGDDVPHRDDDRPDDRHRFRPHVSLRNVLGDRTDRGLPRIVRSAARPPADRASRSSSRSDTSPRPLVGHRRRNDDVLAGLPVHRRRHRVLRRQLAGIEQPQHLVEVAAGGHRIGQHGLDLLVRTDDEDRAHGGVVRGGAAVGGGAGAFGQHVVSRRHLELGIADHRVGDGVALGFLDVLRPLRVVVDRIDAEADDLGVALVELAASARPCSPARWCRPG